jgi:hypothetical protein
MYKDMLVDLVYWGLVSIVIGFTGSRIAVMLFDFMCYGGIFWKFKYWLTKDVFGYWMPNMVGVSVSKGHDILQKRYDEISALSFIIGLLDCKFCMTVWTCAIIALFGILVYGISWICLFYGIIFGYLMTEKI